MSEAKMIKEALEELRQLFPTGSISIDTGATQFDDGDSLTNCSIVVQSAAVNSAKRWRGDSVADCMAQVRAWKASQQ